MCLITSQLTPYTLKSEITAYKIVKKKYNEENVYISPFRYATFDFVNNPSPIELSTGKDESHTKQNHGGKLSVGSGYFHALLDPSQYSLYNEKEHTILKVTIPTSSTKINYKGEEEEIPTVIYLSDNMNEICANNMKIYNKVVDINDAKTNISDINDNIDYKTPEGVTVEYADNNINITTPNYKCTLVISSTNYNTEVQWSKVKVSSDITSQFPNQGKDLPKSYSTAKEYYNKGNEDTQVIKSLEQTYEQENNSDICYEAVTKLANGEYMPSIGELYEIIKYQHYINYTLKLNNADNDKLLQSGIYWSSTPFSSNNAWAVNTNYITVNNLYARQNNYLLLPVKA